MPSRRLESEKSLPLPSSPPKSRARYPERASFWKRIPHWLRLPYECWVYLSSLALFGIGGLIFSFLAFVIFLLLPKPLGKRVGRTTLSALFRFYTCYLQAWGLIKLDIKSVDSLAGQRGLIIVANHISLWDIVFIISRLPNVVCVAKASIMRNPIYGGFARLAGFIPNSPHINMVKQGTKELKSGAQLLIFPEGTRTVELPINSFKGGFAVIAKKAQAPIRTLFISATSPLLSKGWPLIKLPDFPYHYTITSGQSFQVPAETETRSFLKALHCHFCKNLPADPRSNVFAFKNPSGHHSQL
ncbi:MAG: lysophospholipid acyltransferase family protein [Verrucomicrobiales bacterium]